MFRLEIEFRDKSKKSVTVQSYAVGTTVLVLVNEKDKDLEYLNLNGISRIRATEA